MKKIILSAIVLMSLLSCNKEELSSANESPTLANRGCASHEVHQEQMRQNPELAIKMNEIESFTEKAMREGRLVNGKMRFRL